MHIAIIGGGINGIMSAWELARRGARVDLLERGNIMERTSAASTKLLHGGLRYLETGHLGLVRAGLRERAWWIRQAPHIAHSIELLIPFYEHARRPRWKYGLGLRIYNALAGSLSLGASHWLDRQATLEALPGLREDGLAGSYRFLDGQMDDRALGLWAADRAREAGVNIEQHQAVASVSVQGELSMLTGDVRQYDRVVNVTGPWAADLMMRSGIASRYALELVRGSHLLVDRRMPCGALLEVPGSRRVCFVLPYQGKTLIGTTEVIQTLGEPVICSEEESKELIDTHNAYFRQPISTADIQSTIAGLRPLLRFSGDAATASREYAIERTGRVVAVYGGKWTTSRLLGEAVAAVALRAE